MSSPDSGSLEDLILVLLPADGTPVLNRIMRVMLTREMRALVSQDAYFAARDRLFEAGSIGRRRGQGGQIYLMPDQAQAGPEPTASAATGGAWAATGAVTTGSMEVPGLSGTTCAAAGWSVFSVADSGSTGRAGVAEACGRRTACSS